KQRYRMPEFDTRFIDSSIGALALVRGEVVKMAEFTRESFQKLCQCLSRRDDDAFGERDAIEEHMDAMQKSIITYLTTIFQGEVNESEAIEVSEMMRITNNLERIGDSMENVSKLLERIYDNNISLSEGAIQDLTAISKEVETFLTLVIREMRAASPGFMTRAAAQEDLVDQMREKMRYDHIERLRCGNCSVDAGVLFISLLSRFEKMGDYCFNIATGVSRIK
ncbi:MAG: PhoU domain-containing protein, partial [Pseudomonadota bacterium]